MMQRGILLLALALALGSSALQAANTTVRLVVAQEAARPGDTVLAGVQLRMAPKWHTYWRNGGDSGAPTQIEWVLPAGVTAGEIQWPVPERYEKEGFITYVYHGQVVLLVPLKIAADAPPGTHELKAKVSWLECEDLCVAENGEATARLTIGTESRPGPEAVLIETAKSKLPGTKPASEVTSSWRGAAQGDTRVMSLEWTAGPGVTQADFFPFASDNYMVKTTNEHHAVKGGKVTLQRGVMNLAKDWPAEIGGLLVETGAGGQVKAYATTLKLGGAAPAVRGAAPGAQTPAAPATTVAGPEKSFAVELGFAFLGGLILNLMPCVLPVLALKVLGIARQSQEDPGRVRFLGVVYGAGVLCSFLVLAGLVIALQKTTGIASWGMQFQNPQFIICITVLVTLMALNLFGVFEVSAGGGVMDAAGALASREGAAGAFFNGMVAVVLGTACTAPVLGGALGYAFSQSPAVIVIFFMAVGLGLAFPYMLLSFFPALRRFMPKPGAWMERFKVALGFPMLATGVWLLSQLQVHFGADGVLWVGLFLVVLGVAAWVFGQFVQRGAQRRGLAAAIALLLVAAAYGVALEGKLHWRSPAETVTAGVRSTDPEGIAWQPWSPEAVAEARTAGRPVFVDFTADWCLNCQVNKRTSIEIASVRQKLKEVNALPLLGDFTKNNRRIAEELKRHGRAGVPLVLVYPKDASQPPIVLPELLTPSIVLDALERSGK